MTRVKEKYNRNEAERRFEHVYETVEGDRCTYCGMPNDGKYDHQPPVYVLHRFADGGLVTKKAIRETFGQCKLVPCCTICNMGLGSFHGSDDNDRRQEIVKWFLADDRYPEDNFILEVGRRLIESRLSGTCGTEIYKFPGVGRIVYTHALTGLIEGEFNTPDEFPEWLRVTQSELAEWLRATARRKSRYFLNMANLESYELRPHARDNPRGQFNSQGQLLV
ncbi:MULTISPECIES: hypothetical protein [unclassified Mesorhizobium]|uniref:hypothetical protein n=1 Tax=unclassified Mesorhizobium TaxID=325217 RepID=UPI000FCB6174|nr:MULTISPECIES: hypothetical protein [unclassified Mesorhizobium]TGU56913.1 hypothetical protein EN791_029715 [Mesorhizobium sp. M2D.F.Ca.ET.148.01.1.1]TGU61294.1 hypothetical protein EN790_29735 [Mesorhizobium sp. M2D.F.Ca.ET.147.01.1.1]